jgi:hypothetical protein
MQFQKILDSGSRPISWGLAGMTSETELKNRYGDIRAIKELHAHRGDLSRLPPSPRLSLKGEERLSREGEGSGEGRGEGEE